MTIFNKTFVGSNGTPIVSAIRAIVGPDDPNVLVLDYRRDVEAFKALWALGKDNVPTTEAGKQLLDDLADANKTIILVDVDASSVIASDKFGRHVSALNWAHAVYFALVRRGSNLPDIKLPKIGVLDLRDPNSSALKEYGRFKPDCGVEYFQRTSNIKDFSDWLNKLKSGGITAVNVDKDELDITFKQWAFGVGHADSRADHHAMNNSASPLVLAGGCPNEVRSDVLHARKECDGGSETHNRGAAAMMRGFEWFFTKPLPNSSVGSGNNTEASAATNEPVPLDWAILFQQARLKADKELRILLLDDQAKEGWIPVFAHMFGMGVNGSVPGLNSFVEVAARTATNTLPKISLYAATNPEAVLAHITIQSAANSKDRFSLRLTRTEGAAVEILFADLRLFSESDGVESEIKYFERVLEIAKGGVVKQDEYIALKSWLNSIDPKAGYQTWRESPKYLQALTLLVRTVASRDLSFPIALFSSTGQRSITNALAGYPSISTALEKPKFDSYVSTDINADFRQRLGDVLTKHALPYISARVQVQRLLDLAPLHFQENTVRTEPLAVEIFTDEAGEDDEKKPFVVSMIAVVYSLKEAGSLDAAWENANALNRELPGTNICLPSRPGAKFFTFNQVKKPGYIEKRGFENTDSQWELFRQDTTVLFNTLLPFKYIENIFVLSLLGNKNTHNSVDSLSEKGLDQLNFGMLKAGIEALLFELLPDSYPSQECASLYFGSRIRPVVKVPAGATDEVKNAAKLKTDIFTRRWGVRTYPIPQNPQPGEDYKLCYPSIEDGTAPRLASEILALRRNASSVDISILNCRHEAMNLSVWGGKPPPTREIHHLADAFASSVNSSQIAVQNNLPSPFLWLENINGDKFNYAIAEFGASFELALASTRQFDAKDLEQCLLFGCLAVEVHQRTEAIEDQLKVKGALQLLLRKATRATLAISPTQYSEFVGDLQKQIDSNDSGLLRLVVNPSRKLKQGNNPKHPSKTTPHNNKKNEKKSHREGGIQSVPNIGKGIVPAQLAVPAAGYLNVAASEDRAGIQRTTVVKKLPLGKNELRIKCKDSVGEDGVSYAVLALDNGIPCALLSMANKKVAECEIGQIVVVNSMNSNRNAKVGHSEYKLSVLDFAGLGRPNT